MSPTQKRGLAIGLIFTAIVVGLLVYFHASKPQVPDIPGPDLVDQKTDKLPPYWVCTEAPDGHLPAPGWLDAATVTDVLNWWAERCYEVEGLGFGPCEDLCSYQQDESAEPRVVACKEGHVSVSGIDRWFGSGHAGETLHKPQDGELPHILVPVAIDGADPTETVDLPPLPDDVGKLVFAHEVGHSFKKDHTITELGSTGAGAPKKGDLMHPQVRVLIGEQWFPGIGWGDADLSRCPTVPPPE